MLHTFFYDHFIFCLPAYKILLQFVLFKMIDFGSSFYQKIEPIIECIAVFCFGYR